MKIAPGGLFFKVFIWLWLTLMLFAITPIIIFTLGNQNNRTNFFNEAVREAEKRIHIDLRDAASADDMARLKKIANKAETRMGVDTYIFDKEQKEINNKTLPADIANILDEMSDGKLVMIKKLNQDPQSRVVRVLKSNNFTIVSYPAEGRNPSYWPIIIKHHLHILLYMILLSSAASLIIVRIFVRPLVSLSKASRQIADGDFSVRVSEKVKSTDEIGVLAKDFDIMADKLQKNRENQETMLRNISHELRSPLTRLRLSLELARSKSDDETQPALDRIEKESEKLNEMIGNLLEISRLRGDLSIKKQDIDIKIILNNIRRDCGFEASETGKHLYIKANEDFYIHCSPELLTSCLENIIRNAIKYAEKDIVFTAEKKSDKSIFIICDDGAGVEESKLEEIFAPFYRVQSDRDRKTGGTGLGLAIAKAVIDAHKGTVCAENTTDSGLKIIITIPN